MSNESDIFEGFDSYWDYYEPPVRKPKGAKAGHVVHSHSLKNGSLNGVPTAAKAPKKAKR